MDGIKTAFKANVGAEPELKASRYGEPCVAVTAYVDDRVQQFMHIAVFGERAQQFATRLHKGDRIYCEGRLKLEGTWTGKDNRLDPGLLVEAWKVERLDENGNPAKPKAPPEDEHCVPPAINGALGRTRQQDDDWVFDDDWPF